MDTAIRRGDFADHQSLVDTLLNEVFTEATARAAILAPGYAELWRQLRANTDGGKRFRPRLVMAVYDAFGGTDWHGVAHVAASIELLHTALIVHDDVIDRDFVRRGIPNVSGVYRDIAQTAGLSIPTAEHRGMGVGVIAGDLALATAFRLMRRASSEPAVCEQLLELLDRAVFDSAAGELIDVDFTVRAGVASVDEIVHMERLKTAVYSFEIPLVAGALLARADGTQAEVLGQIGTEIGIAYQVVDDLLGVFGDERLTGKTTLGDLREGKQTALIAVAAETDAWDELQPYVGNPQLTHDDLVRARELFERSGAKARAEALAAEHIARAEALIDSSTLPLALQLELRGLAQRAVERSR